MQLAYWCNSSQTPLPIWPSRYPDSACHHGGTDSWVLWYFSWRQSLCTFLKAKLFEIKYIDSLYTVCIPFRWWSLAREVKARQLLTEFNWSKSQHSTPVYFNSKYNASKLWKGEINITWAMETNVNVYQVQVHINMYQESTNSLSVGW